MANRFISCFRRQPTGFSPRSRALVRIDCRARLRRPSWAYINLAILWLRSTRLRTTPDATVAQILRARAREARRSHRRTAMSRTTTRHAQLIRLCRARGCSREDAEDVVQEGYQRLLEYQCSARVTDSDSLLRRIVINLSINHYHRDPSGRFRFESVERLDRQGLLIHPGTDPERTLAAQQELDRLVSVLNAVSTRTCQIFIVQRGGYSYQEIAAAFAIRPRTVEKHVASAMLALEEMMPAEFAAESTRGSLTR
jgi:RNA polymerase sigma factor (sigma-70 family)